MTSILQWGSIATAFVFLAVYSLYRDHRDIRNERLARERDASLGLQQLLFRQPKQGEQEKILTNS